RSGPSAPSRSEPKIAGSTSFQSYEAACRSSSSSSSSRWTIAGFANSPPSAYGTPAYIPCSGRGLRLREIAEQLAEVVCARLCRMLDQLVEDQREDVPREHPCVLGEETPDALQDQVRADVRLRAAALLEPLEDLRHERHRLTREFGAILDVPGPEAAEEAQRLVLLRKGVEIERRHRTVPVNPRLEHLEPAERADDDVTSGLPGPPADVLPVLESLLAVSGEVACLARALHLDDADSRPDHVDDPGAGRILEVGDVLPVDAVAGEQLVEER